VKPAAGCSAEHVRRWAVGSLGVGSTHPFTWDATEVLQGSGEAAQAGEGGDGSGTTPGQGLEQRAESSWLVSSFSSSSFHTRGRSRRRSLEDEERRLYWCELRLRLFIRAPERVAPASASETWFRCSYPSPWSGADGGDEDGIWKPPESRKSQQVTPISPGTWNWNWKRLTGRRGWWWWGWGAHFYCHCQLLHHCDAPCWLWCVVVLCK